GARRGLHRSEHHRDRRTGSDVFADELLQQRVRSRQGLSRRYSGRLDLSSVPSRPHAAIGIKQMNILHIDSSPRRQSHSHALAAAIVGKLLEIAPGASITRRDLGAEPLPHTPALYAAALASPATLAAPPTGSLDVSEALIREVEAADTIVIGTPMHN